MSFQIDLNIILNKLSDIKGTKKTPQDLTDDEKKALQEADINPENYKKLMDKLGAEDSTERKQVMEELQKLIDKIKELAPNNYGSIIAGLIGDAGNNPNIKSLEDVLNLFVNTIKNLEEGISTPKEKELKELINRFSSFDAGLENKDYKRLLQLVKSVTGNDAAVITENGQNVIKFTWNKPYELRVNQEITSDNADEPKTRTTIPQDQEKIRNIIKEFIAGRMNWQDLYEQLKPYCNFESFQEYMETLSYNEANDGYLFNIKIGDTEYKFTCDRKSVDDTNLAKDITNNNYGDENVLFTPSDLSQAGLNPEPYFQEAASENGKVQYYTKNKKAWEELSVTSDNINDLKAAIQKAEQLQHLTEIVNNVITALTSSFNLSSDEVEKLKGHLQSDSIKTSIESMSGKTDDEIRAFVRSAAETFITETLRKAGDSTRGDNSDPSAQTTSSQGSTTTPSESVNSSGIDVDKPEFNDFMRQLYEILNTEGLTIDGVNEVDSGSPKIRIRSKKGESAGTIEVTKSSVKYNANGANIIIGGEVIAEINSLVLKTLK